MKKGLIRGGCALASVIILLLALAGGAWWFFMGQYTAAAVPPASPVQVFLLSPSSGDDVGAGDFVLVDLQAVAPGAISWSEVFVDGKSLGALTESPERASWTWQAWPAGVHVLSGRSQAADGQLGESQTVIVNVVSLDETMQVQAEASETIGQVGAKFGVPPDQMAAANPDLDPAKPLEDGQPVKVPTGAAGAGSPPPSGGGANDPGGGSIPFAIQWELKLTGQVDKSYCYLTDGSGVWDKVPKPPFEFFGGLDNLYSQVFDATPGNVVTMQAQCWGWLGGVLKYLGQGSTKPIGTDPIQIIGDGFQLTGLPKWPEGSEVPTVDLTYTVPPPFALRTPKNAADCTAHAAPIVGPFICNTLMGAAKSQYIVLEWEWQPGLSVPGGAVAINDIAGYMLYEIIPDTGAPPQYLKSVQPLGARAAAVPVPWEKRCYGVRAFADNPKYGEKRVSEMTTYCPGQPPATQKTILKPSEWITTEKDLIVLGCGNYGNADAYHMEQQQSGFGLKPEIEVGSQVVQELACSRLVTHSGGVKFPQPVLPPGAVIQKALLTFSRIYMTYGATGYSYGAKPQSCVASIGKAKQDWSGLNNNTHFSSTYLATSAYSQPVTSLSQFFNQADVTTVVSDWVKNPSHNHGLILAPVSAPEPKVTGQGECTSGLGGFQLEILYLAP